MKRRPGPRAPSAAPTLDQAAKNALLAYDDPLLERAENVRMGGGAEAYQIRGKRGIADFCAVGGLTVRTLPGTLCSTR